MRSSTEKNQILEPTLWQFPQTSLFPDLNNWIYLFLLAVFCTVGLCFLQLQALKKISAFTANLSYNLEPIYSILMAVTLLDEINELNFSFYIGLGLILLSVGLQMSDLIRQSKQQML